MNILVIGNGFDLAHGLPTKYTDFLEFVKIINQIIKDEKQFEHSKIQWGNIHPEIKKLLEIDCGNVKDNIFTQLDMWKALLKGNVWIEYFLQCDMHGKENWIDFESEISEVIKSIDRDKGEKDIYTTVLSLSNMFFNDKYTNNNIENFTAAFNGKNFSHKNNKISFKELRDVLCKDLEKLIRSFEIYLTYYVGRIDAKIYSPDIKEIDVDKVLSFNYTSTFEKFYESIQEVDYDFIHGKAFAENTLQMNNMVLGIDEYLDDERKNKEIVFIAFKKFYQRIQKGTGCKYREWVDEIYEDREIIADRLDWQEQRQIPFKYFDDAIQHNIFIYGHSLDETDKDILRELILNDNVYTTIYYRKRVDKNGEDDNGREDLGSKIANLVKVIGPDELIKRTGGSTKTIEFKLQRDMQKIEA